MVLTAKEWGWSPTAVIRGANNPHKHHPADYNFAHAVKTLLEEKCPSCGVPIWWAMSSSSDIDYDLKTIVCHACEHKDTATRDQERKPGETQVVYAIPADEDTELPSRMDYMERMAKEHQKEHEKELARKTKEAQQ